MSDELYAIPPTRRRRMALALAPLGVALLVTAVLTITLDGAGWKLAGLLVAALAVVLLGVAWGLQRSAALSEAAEAEQRLDAVLTAAAGSSGGACGSAGSEGGSLDSEGGSAGSSAAPCGTTGLVCGLGGADGGCGAACLARTR
ncbi:MAG TPA: hypothetical protein VGB75_08175 [Jatrophihabitans sp.]|uniref:hypothetical protein n=1 Tax=Jatrophihabitans sp. TaxID=1932789 RepID=UPI002F25A675